MSKARTLASLVRTGGPLASGQLDVSTLSNVNLASQVTGTLPVANGGTGATSAESVLINLGAQATLISGTNIKTVNGASILGSEDISVGYRNIPPVGTKTTQYTLQITDVGTYVQVGSGGSIIVPNSIFSEGDAVSIFNNTSGNITITCPITTAYIAGTDSDKASVTLATRGVATILFISGTVCVITGNVS